jgi:hypothetical protein
MENEEKKSKLEELKKHLNSRSYSPNEEREDLQTTNREFYDVKGDWEEKESPPINYESLRSMARKKRNSLKTFLIISILFFFVALTVTAYIIFGGSNIISSENVEISVSGPVSISGGETLSLDIIVSNNNSADLELTNLIVEYPEGTRSPENISTELPRERFSLGNIVSGSKTSQEINAVLFGEEGDRVKIKLTIEYRVAGSNAIFFKEREYEVEISSSPVSFNIESLIDVNSGQEISLDVSLQSNSNNLIEDLMFIVEYPFGFTFKESSPSPSFDQNIWKIGDLSPGEERKIKITGIIEGQDGEERVFRLFSGIQSQSNERQLETAFVSSTRSVFIKKPFLAINVALDGDTSTNFSTSMNDNIDVSISWRNNLPTSIANVEIVAVLSGDFDESSVFVQNGFYNSINNTVTWNQERNPVFESVSPGQSGTVSFRVSSVDFLGSSLTNPEASIVISVRGRRLSEVNVTEEVLSSVERNIRFNTDYSLVPRIIYSSASISNTGPIPPKAESQTTYNVIWTLSNSVNDLSDVVVSTRIPSYVSWTGNVLQNGENIVYNPVSREISWNVGSVDSGTGFKTSSREAVFQISFLPSLSQIGQSPVLIEKTRIIGKDDFTGSILQSIKSELTTQISTDPNFGDEDGRVVE